MFVSDCIVIMRIESDIYYAPQFETMQFHFGKYINKNAISIWLHTNKHTHTADAPIGIPFHVISAWIQSIKTSWFLYFIPHFPSFVHITFVVFVRLNPIILSIR